MQDSIYYQNEYKKLLHLQETLNASEDLFFYGAGLRSKELIQMNVEGFSFFKNPKAFIVSDMQKDEKQTDSSHINNIPIYLIDNLDATTLKKSTIVVVAMDIYHSEIKNTLDNINCKNVHFLTNAMYRLLTRDFFKYYFNKINLPFNITPFDENFKTDYDTNSIHTYSVMCEKDASLANKPPLATWVSTIQAGAALANQIVSDITDNTGDSISTKNPYYNELTGLYWVWKNTEHPFTGICHYRRRFESDIALMPLLNEKADLILPMPFIVYPSMAKYYQNWGESSYYGMMLNVINDLFPDYYSTALSCTGGCCFIPNNICITKKEILHDYCEFLFTVIDEVEKRMENYSGKKQTRCWLSEHVSTIYFMHHMTDYKVFFSNLIRYW